MYIYESVFKCAIPGTHYFYLLLIKMRFPTSLLLASVQTSLGPNRIPTKVLKLLKDEISSYLFDIYNISFSISTFPSVLKTVKRVSVHKKYSKLNCNNYHPISLLPNIEKKIIQKLVYNRITKFLNNKNLIYPFGFQHLYSTNHALINLN